MAYTKTTWVNDQAPAISATNLNKLETQYDEAVAEINTRFSRLATVTPEQFGAVGNGVADDTAALEAARVALVAAGGGTLVGTKVYKVIKITVSSNIFYKFNNARIVGSSATPEGIFEAEGWAAPAVTISNWAISGAQIDGNAVARRAIFITRSSGGTIVDNKIYGLGGTETNAIRLHNDTDSVLVAGNKITMPVDSPLGTLTSAVGIYCISVTPDLQGGGQNATLTFGEPTRLSTNHLISNNVIANGTHGVHLSGATETTIISNHISGTTHRGVIMSPLASRNVVANNRIKDYGSTAVHMAWGCTWNTIVGNNCQSTVSGQEGNGIKGYYGCSNNVVSGNSVDGALNGALRFAVGSSFNIMADNRIANAGIGIHLQSSLPSASGYYQPATPPDTRQNVATGNLITLSAKGVEIEAGGTSSVTETTLSGNSVVGATTSGYSVVELTSTLVSSVAAIGNSSTGTSLSWVIPRGERHFTQKSGNTDLMDTPDSPVLRSGPYWQCIQAFSATTSASLGINVLRVAPMRLGNAITISRIGIETTASGEAGGVIRIAIYADNGFGYPGRLVADFGTVPGDAVAVSEITTSTLLTPGTYWVGTVNQNVTTSQPTIRSLGTTNGVSTELIPFTASVTPGTNAAPSIGYAALGVTGAAPSVWPASVNLTGVVSRTFIKVA